MGHASLEQTTATGTQEATSGERLEVQFAQAAGKPRGSEEGEQSIRSAVIDGHVVMTEQEPARGKQAATQLRGTSGHAVYDGAGQWLHLTVSPRIEESGLVVTADTVDVSQGSGDAFARGNVKATWMGNGEQAASGGAAAPGGVGLGGDEPAHVIAAEAEMRRATDEATFRGTAGDSRRTKGLSRDNPSAEARLWQGANSVSAPVIVLNRTRQTLVAHGGAAQPVNLVLLSAAHPERSRKTNGSEAAAPEVVRVQAGELNYSAAERKAELSGEGAGGVVAQAEGATVRSSEAELTLLPAGQTCRAGGSRRTSGPHDGERTCGDYFRGAQGNGREARLYE